MQTTIDIRSDNYEFLNKLHKLSIKHEINEVLGFTWHWDGESVTITQKCETDTKEHTNLAIALIMEGLAKE